MCFGGDGRGNVLPRIGGVVRRLLHIVGVLFYVVACEAKAERHGIKYGNTRHWIGNAEVASWCIFYLLSITRRVAIGWRMLPRQGPANALHAPIYDAVYCRMRGEPWSPPQPCADLLEIYVADLNLCLQNQEQSIRKRSQLKPRIAYRLNMSGFNSTIAARLRFVVARPRFAAAVCRKRGPSPLRAPRRLYRVPWPWPGR